MQATKHERTTERRAALAKPKRGAKRTDSALAPAVPELPRRRELPLVLLTVLTLAFAAAAGAACGVAFPLAVTP